MGLALDEPRDNDERVEVEGFSFLMDSQVADMIRTYGKLSIDYSDHFWTKGFQLSLSGITGC